MRQRAMEQQVLAGGSDEPDDLRDRPPAGPLVQPGVLLLTGLGLGVAGDVLLRAGAPPGLNMFLWLSAVAGAAVVLQRRAGGEVDRERLAWLGIAVLFAAGLVWRDAPPLKLLALGSVTVAFALAAYRLAAVWVRRESAFRYVRAWATGALHAWTAAAHVLLDASRATRPDIGEASAWRRATGVARGLLIALPLLALFGALFVSADAVFEGLVLKFVRVDFERIVSHVVLFSVFAWIGTGYLRGFLTGTELPPLHSVWKDSELLGLVPKRPTLGITEVATVLAALDLLFLLFVLVQFRYLFGGDALVQVTPDLTYAEYARDGFFELVFAVTLVVPLLLAADWLLDRQQRRDDLVFRALAGLQIVLMLAITASAFQRLRLYHAGYGLTESRLYAMVLLIWIGAMLLWFAATVLRDWREAFGFGALASALATIAVLFALNPDALIARTNIARLSSADAAVRFDVTYATSLSADAVPVLVAALPALPADVQCPLARHMLRRWGPDTDYPLRAWNRSASRASDVVRTNEALLRSMVGPDQQCPSSGG